LIHGPLCVVPVTLDYYFKHYTLKRLFIFLLALVPQMIMAQNIEALFADYNNQRSGTRLQSANTIMRFLYKQELEDSLIQFNASTRDYVVDAYLLQGMCEYMHSRDRFADAILLGTRSAKISESHRMMDLAASSYSTLCVSYQRTGDLSNALRYGKRVYDLDMRSGDKANQSSSLNNLATLCLYGHRLGEAERYILRAIDTERPLKRNGKLAIRLGVASEVYTAQGKYAKAVAMAHEAYSLDSLDGNEGQMAKRLAQLAAAYQAWGKLDKAETSYKRALAMLRKHGEQTSIAIACNQLGQVIMQQGDMREAERYLLEAYSISTSTDNKIQRMKTCEALAKLYADSDPRQALRYKNVAFDLQRSIFDSESERQLNNFNVLNKVKENEAQIATFKEQRHHHRVERFVAVALLMVCLLLMGVHYSKYQLNKKRNRELLEAALVKDKFFSIISHDLKGPLISQKDALEVMARGIDNMPSDVLHDLCEETYNSSKQLLTLLQNLLQWSRLQTGRIKCNPVAFSLVDVAREVESQEHLQLEGKKQKLLNDIGEDAVAMGDRAMVATVMRNLVANAIKYTPERGTVSVSAVPTGNQYEVRVTDTGVGMSPATVNSLFKLGVSNSTPGTMGEKGTGLGLVVSSEFLKLHGQRLHVESRTGEGTTFSFNLNKA
jgi:signal transduction histidine kinase